MSERVSHGEPCFFVEGKRPLCYFHDNHRGGGRVSLWCPSPAGVPVELTASEPVGSVTRRRRRRGVFAGWLGVYLDADGDDRVDRGEDRSIIEEAFRTIAPKRLIARLDETA